MHRFCLPGGANSATMAAAVPTSAPTPMPVRNRAMPNIVALVDIAVTAMKTANHA